MERYRVAIVESSPLVAEGLKAILSHSAEMEVIIVCRTIADLVPMLPTADIDVVVAQVTQSASCDMLGETPVVGLQTSMVDGEMLRPFLSLINLYTPEDAIVSTVREAVHAPADKCPAESHELSERERDVLVLVARGLTNKEIATKLHISPHTVISHRKNIVHKTGIRSVAGLAVYAVLNKLVENE